MDPHLGHAFPHGVAIAEVAECRATQARQLPCLSLPVGQFRKPNVELL
jgi:hypothetical protein